LRFFFFFTLKKTDFGDFSLYYPYPSFFKSISVQLFYSIRIHFVQNEFTLINVGSFDTLVAVLYVSALLAAIFSIPVWVYEISAFVSPALTKREKRVIRLIALPSIFLFLLGVFFAYEVVLPALFKILYLLTVALGVEPTMSVRTFVSIVIVYMLALGASFEIPVVMLALSYLRIVSYETWKRNWRWVVLICFFIALLISPGATGGLMETVIGLTLSSLYLLGLLLVKLLVKTPA
jgi:sec-independent protein translocase protein TatC